jgi:hypothetical protein
MSFYQYPVTYQSPHGSFEMRQISESVWVCICNNPTHRFARGWPTVADFPLKFILYLGYNPEVSPWYELWVRKLATRYKFGKVEFRQGKEDRTGMSREIRIKGITAQETLAIAYEDSLPF